MSKLLSVVKNPKFFVPAAVVAVGVAAAIYKKDTILALLQKGEDEIEQGAEALAKILES